MTELQSAVANAEELDRNWRRSISLTSLVKYFT